MHFLVRFDLRQQRLFLFFEEQTLLQLEAHENAVLAVAVFLPVRMDAVQVFSRSLLPSKIATGALNVVDQV